MAMPAISAAAMVPRKMAMRNGSVFRNFRRITRPQPQFQPQPALHPIR